MTERLHMRFYYGTAQYLSLRRPIRENGAFFGASLAVLRQVVWSQMGDKVCLDTDEIGPHDREIAYY